MVSSHEAPAYAELHALSNFSFLRGASHPEELVERAQALGLSALALTDECSLAGSVRAHVAAKRVGLKLLHGAEFRLNAATIVLLVPDKNAYGDLCELITRARSRAPKGEYRLDLDDFVAAGSCLAIVVPCLAAVADEAAETELEALCAFFARAFSARVWLGVELLRGPDDAGQLERLQALGARFGLPLAACGDVHMHVRARRALQDTLTAIRLRTTVAEAGLALFPNGERHLRPRARLGRIYPAPLLQETLAIAERCSFSLDELRYEYPREWLPTGATPSGYLRVLTEHGARERWPQGVPTKVRALIEHELKLIGELHYEAYFLTVHDLVRFARARGILCQGRGSAANSAVCFCLGVTAVDPARMEMLFERFISKERNEPPDIDIDFEHERREEVLQYVYAKYGRARAALAATVITYRARSAVRDVAKALGFESAQVDALAKALAWWEGREALPQRLRDIGVDPTQARARQLLLLVQDLVGFPRHLSQHVGGMVMSQERLSRLVPIENAAMENRTVIQWDKNDIEALGLMKVDCLALGMLSAIRKTLDIVSRTTGKPLTLAAIPSEDPRVYAMISRAQTVGVFQIESRAQMSMLPRLRPRTFYDLVVQVAIVRPGPIQGGMVHPYLRRRQGLEPVTYPHADVRAVLERTLGVPIFQEQVIKLAMVAAGFSPGEADALRRSMAAWHRQGGLDPFEARLISGMRARGYSEAYARQIFAQIQGFGDYGFPESHAASFALLAYSSAWLKCHYPAAFLCGLLNSQPMGFYAPAQLVYDAKRQGVQVLPLDVAVSEVDSTVTPTGAVRLGLKLARGLSQAGAARIVAARAQGAFESVAALARRAQLDRRDLDALARADALRGLSGHRRRAHWAVQGVERPLPLLAAAPVQEALPLLTAPSAAQEVLSDYAAVGLSLRAHPLALLRPQLKGIATAHALEALANDRPVTVAGLVVTRQRPHTASGVVFLTLEDETGVINVIVWRDVVMRYQSVLLQAAILKVRGKLQREQGVTHVIASRLTDLSPTAFARAALTQRGGGSR